MKKVILAIALSQLVLLQGCALDTFSAKPDDPKYAPALPEEDYTNAVPTGGIYNPYTMNNGMYSDTSAHKVGDIISVTLEEATSASKNASTDLEKEGNNNYGGITLASKKLHYKNLTPTLSSSNSNDFSGSAKAKQSNQLSGQISVSVVKVYSNGNLQVQGEKWLMLNNGNEYVRVTGLIRPSDISSDNTVSSQRIANARIQYGGTGDFADVRELILNMQVRFLKLAGKDDRARFEKLQRACMSVCDYTNQPGFSLQERLLRDAYREIRELEEEIKKHPSREAVEILWMCTDGADGANIFAKLKKEIAQLLNSMYQDEKTRPKIWCKPNQELIENGQKTFWLIVGNGAANMNLQSADNVGIILESYTEGVDVPSKIVLEQKHLAAGDQIPVEVAISVEEGYTGSLNIGWADRPDWSCRFLHGQAALHYESYQLYIPSLHAPPIPF